MGWRTDVKLALAIALVIVLFAGLRVTAPYIPNAYAEMCPYPHCMDDIPGTDSASPR